LRSARLKLWLPPKVWLQGSQSTSTGGRSSRKGQAWASACWFEQSMRWLLITPLGLPVEPEVKRILATVSGPTAAKRSSTAEPGATAGSAAKRVSPPAGLALTTSSAPPISAKVFKAAANRPPSAA
jgi:hypothetical protein